MKNLLTCTKVSYTNIEGNRLGWYQNHSQLIMESERRCKDRRSIIRRNYYNEGVWQGCILSPVIFNIYTERIFKESVFWKRQDVVIINY